MMKSADGKTKAEKLAEKNGTTFYRIRSDKFKTSRVDVFFADSLGKERATGNAILPFILKRGCKLYPDQRTLEKKLETLYGADVDGGVSKKGEMQFISFHMSHVADRFASGQEKLFDECSQLLMCMLENPIIEDNGLKASIFKQERDNLIDYLRSRINDKMRFSFLRCMEEMCSGEPFEASEDGSEEQALLLTPQKAYAYYQDMLTTYPAYVYISGDVDDSSVQRFMDKFLANRQSIKKVAFSPVEKKVTEVKRIDESMDVSQGKLCMGFRTNVEPASDDYFPLVVYNGILGGDVHSKLFQNVREKASLAYYAQSILEKYKGLMVIMSGIEQENRKRAEELIIKQFEDMKKGIISDQELKATKNSLRNGIYSMQDSQGAIVDFFLSQHIAESGEDFDSMHEKLQAVTPEDVVRIANGIHLDTVYFLQPTAASVQEGEEKA